MVPTLVTCPQDDHSGEHLQNPSLYKLPDILTRGSFSKSHVYNLMERGRFPRPCLVMGPRFTRWSSTDIDSWFRSPQEWIDANATGPTA
jgi:prophage regulatory protein